MKEYEVQITTQYQPNSPYSIWVYASTAKQAISQARRKARNEMWFNRYNDGRVTYKVIH